MKKRFLLVLVAAVCLFSQSRIGKLPTGYAANTAVNFDETSVLDDLQGSTVGETPFDLTDYPYDESGTVQALNFVEYCYSYRANMQGNYGLYLYIYNPAALDFNTASLSNKVQMATAYAVDKKPVEWGKFGVQCVSVSTGDYARLFYKLKIRFSDEQRTALLTRLNSNERRYDLSGVELLTKGAANAAEYTIATTYLFSGYAKGYGADTTADSTLTSETKKAEVIMIDDLRQSNFRSNTSALGANHQNELNSVYFGLDNAVLNEYGRLQRIMAEWYEYKTVPAIMVNDTAVYNNIKPYTGQLMTEHASGVYGLYEDGYFPIADPVPHFSWAWQPWVGKPFYGEGGTGLGSLNVMPRMTICLPKADGERKDKLQEYLYDYDKSFAAGTLPIKDGTISRDLFADSVDTERVMGYNLREFDANSISDEFNLLSYDSNHNGWQKFWDFGFGAPPTNGDFLNVNPIYAVTAADILGSDSEVAQRLLLNVSDVSTFKQAYNANTAAGETTFLFRFAHTDYYAVKLSVQMQSGIMTGTGSNLAYKAQETVFLDFDMIQMTFNKDGVYHVIPVVSSPIDVINAYTPPLLDEDLFPPWLKAVLMLLLLIVLIVVLAPVLPIIVKAIIAVLKAVWSVITFPFRAIAKASKKDKGG
jgi:hypothetical protein